MKTIFVIGAGKGLGNAVARKFGRNGFRVVLLSRSPEHLEEYRKEFADAGIACDVQAVDVSSPGLFVDALDTLKEKYGTPDVLFYNVGVMLPDAGLKDRPRDASLLLERYGTDVVGAYDAIQQILGEEFSNKNGTILITGGGLAMYPMADYLPLSMDKAALRAMCLALGEELKKQNVFLGTVTVTGAIEKGTDWDPDVLAEDFWKLYTQRDEHEIIH